MTSCKNFSSSTLKLLIITAGALVFYFNELSAWASDLPDHTPSLDRTASDPDYLEPSRDSESFSYRGSSSFSGPPPSLSSSLSRKRKEISPDASVTDIPAQKEVKEVKEEIFSSPVQKILETLNTAVLLQNESYKEEIPKILLSLKVPLEGKNLEKELRTRLFRAIKDILIKKFVPGTKILTNQVEQQIQNILQGKPVKKEALQQIANAPLIPTQFLVPSRQWVGHLNVENVTTTLDTETIQWSGPDRNLVRSIDTATRAEREADGLRDPVGKNAALLRIGLIKKNGENYTYFDQLVPLVFMSGYSYTKVENSKAWEGHNQGEYIIREASENALPFNFESIKDLVYLDDFNPEVKIFKSLADKMLKRNNLTLTYFQDILRIPREILNLMTDKVDMFMDAEQAAVRAMMVGHGKIKLVLEELTRKAMSEDKEREGEYVLAINLLSQRSTCSQMKNSRWGCTETLAYLARTPGILCGAIRQQIGDPLASLIKTDKCLITAASNVSDVTEAKDRTTITTIPNPFSGDSGILFHQVPQQ